MTSDPQPPEAIEDDDFCAQHGAPLLNRNECFICQDERAELAEKLNLGASGESQARDFVAV